MPEGRRKKEEGRRKREEGRGKNIALSELSGFESVRTLCFDCQIMESLKC
ncbi:MAG: hypothetical protein F6K48_09100 [Okeania sp. SIO3H1]|nr:hypothetical protein [Okeania sp. SIO1I7]NEN89052.1 hypothetical protein [Okeania sp. SIO3H1]NET25197.1 hypothetical protein [Okeania sp. SIO1I7]